ncbi:LuxR C-terminal-related transcriptional regulator [Roseovarius sp.]|uniref:LuxR C-terminal-related transcriptional regulator n=1 Tax=Roseovarius sp. TaxID=1486281 RepID=UPI003B599504
MLAARDECAGAQPVSSVMIVDDHPLYSDALETALTLGFPGCDIRKAGSLQACFDLVNDDFRPDLVMFDLKLPDVTGVSGFEKLRARLPEARVLVISSLASSELVRRLLRSGAMGFLPKDASAKTLHFAVTEIAAGRRYVPAEYVDAEAGEEQDDLFKTTPELSILTPQQVNILKLICAGKPNKQIAYELSLAEATVKAHITALLRRLDVRNRTQAVVFVESVMARHAEPEARAFLQH